MVCKSAYVARKLHAGSAAIRTTMVSASKGAIMKNVENNYHCKKCEAKAYRRADSNARHVDYVAWRMGDVKHLWVIGDPEFYGLTEQGIYNYIFKQ